MNKPFTSCFVALITALIARPAVSGANTAGQIPLWPKGAPCEKGDIGEDRDGFAREKPIVLSRQMNEFAFTLESRSPQSHQTALTIAGLPTGNYVARAGADSKRFHMKGEASTTILLPVTGARSVDVRIERDLKFLK